MDTKTIQKFQLNETDIKSAIAEYISKKEKVLAIPSHITINHQVETTGMGMFESENFTYYAVAEVDIY